MQEHINRKMDWGEEPEFFGPRHYFRESLILRSLLRHVPKAGKVFDGGSGNGSMAIRIGRAGYRRVLGIDGSNAFVAYASRRAKEEKLDAVLEFRKGDLMELDIQDECFDAVVSGEVLEHIREDARAAGEFYRILKKGGVCIVTVPANPRLWDKNDEWAGHFRRYTGTQLRQLFEENGFEIIRCSHWGFPLIRLFHKFIYLPMVDRKILKEKKNISRETGPFIRLLKNERLHRLGAAIFLFDNLFNRLPFGLGLILVARRP